MFAITFTVLPTQTTALQTESNSGSASGSVRADEIAQGSGSASNSGAQGGTSDVRSTVTTSQSAGSNASGFSIYEDGAYVEIASGGGENSASGFTAISWNGAFTYANEVDGVGAQTIGSPVTGAIWTNTTASESFIKFASVLTTTTVSTVTAGTDVENLGTVSAPTTASTTITGEVTHNRKTTVSESVIETTAYTAEGITHIWQPEFGTILVPQENEVIWLANQQNDGPLHEIANSYSEEITIYPEKKFFSGAVVGENFDPAFGFVEQTSTTWQRSNDTQAITVRINSPQVLPPQTATATQLNVSVDSGTGTFTIQTAATPSAQITQTTIKSWIAAIAGSNFTATAMTTRTASYFDINATIVSGSSSFTDAYTETDDGFDFVDEKAEGGGAFGGERNFSLPQEYFYAKPLGQISAASRVYTHGWFALSSPNSAASNLQAGGLTISIPTTLLANQTVRGVWPTTWSYTSNASSITASAWGDGVSLSKREPEGTALTTTSGAWNIQGSAQTNVVESTRRGVVGGWQALDSVTLVASPGTFFTFNSAGSGTQFREGDSVLASGETVTGVLPAPNYLFGGNERAFLTARNRTSLPA